MLRIHLRSPHASGRGEINEEFAPMQNDVNDRYPLVSILCPCKNREKTITRCINSILAQDYPSIEIIVQDGASTDGTLEILQSYGQRIQLISEPDSGPEEAFGRALARIGGEFFGSCLSDEELLPHAVSWAVENLQKYPEVAAIYGDTYHTDIDGNITGDVRPQQWDFESYLCSEWTPPFNASFFRTSCFQALDMHEYVGADEFDFWIGLAARFPIRYVPGMVGKYALHPGQLSRQVSQCERWVASRKRAIERLCNNPGTPEHIRSLRDKAIASLSTWRVEYYLGMGAWDLAKKHALEAFRNGPNQEKLRKLAEWLYYRGRELYQQGSLEQALEYVDLLVKCNVVGQDLNYLRAKIIQELGQISETTEAAHQDLKVRPGHRAQKEDRPKGQTLHVIGDANSQNKAAQSKRVRVAADYVRAGTQVEAQSSFGAEIRKLFSEIRPRKIIETGTYLGAGTTTIISRALEALGIRDAVVYTIEVNPQNYARAKEYFAANKMNVQALNGLSVPRSMLPDRDQIARRTITDVDYDGIFVDHKEERRVELYHGETNFPQVEDDLLYKCLERFDFRPDFVLLDSAGHIGSIEFDYLIENLQGECYIALDDIYHVKHHRSFQRIQSDPRFEVITASKEKFGFCIARFTPRADVRMQTVRHLLWVRTDSIGDAVLSSSMLPPLRNKYPAASITVVCQEHIAELYEACDAVDRIVTIPTEHRWKDQRHYDEFLDTIRALNPDLLINSVYSVHGLSDLKGLEFIPERIAIRQSPQATYTRLIPISSEIKSELQRHRAFLHGLGIVCESLEPSAWITQADIDYADAVLSEYGLDSKNTIAFFAGTRTNNRAYEGYSDALRPIVERLGCSVIALGWAAEHAISQVQLDALKTKKVNLCGQVTLRQSAAILSRCRIAFGAETGLAHIAAAVGVPHVILIGGGHFGRFMPYSPLTSLVCLPLNCYGCDWSCRYKQVRCIRGVKPYVITRALEDCMSGSSDKTRIYLQNSVPSEYDNRLLASEAIGAFANPDQVSLVYVDSQENRNIHIQGGSYDVSIVLATKNRAKLLDNMISSLKEAVEGISYEIIVIEGGSSDDTPDVLRKHNITQIYKEEECLGPGRHSWPQLYNFGFSKARGKWAMYASDDIAFREHCISKALEILNKQNEDVAGGIFYYKNLCSTEPQWADFGIDFTYGPKLLMNYGLVRLDYFRQLGGFDEAYRFYCADGDLCLKLYEKGKQLIPLPGCFVTHNNVLDVQKKENLRASNSDIELYSKRWLHFVPTHQLPNPRRLMWKHNLLEQSDVDNLKSGSDNEKIYSDTSENLILEFQKRGLLRANQPLRLHLGCGEQHFEGYINIDYPPSEHSLIQVKADIYADIKSLDFPSESVDEVRLHHVFEHFNRVTALAMLIKWHKWLKIGGRIHIETPDLIGSAKTLVSNASWKTKTGVVRHLAGDQAAHWGYHVDHWFAERFERTLSALGFESVQTRSTSWTKEPYLANVEVVAVKTRDNSLQEQLKAAETLLWESAVAPEEKPTWEVWRKQLHAVLRGDFIPSPSNTQAPDVSSISQAPAILSTEASQLPLDEIHDFNQRARNRWVQAKAGTVPAGSRVLDVGAGTCPYRSCFAHCDYKTHDFKKYKGIKKNNTTEYGPIDFVSDITNIPVADESFDVIICTEVLEHVPEPVEALREMARILKRGGRIFVTAPLGSGLHQLPYHYYGGLSPQWYRHFFPKFGLQLKEISPNGGFFKLLAQECARVAWTLPQHQHLHGNNVEFIRNLFKEWLPRYLFALDEKCFIDQFTVGYHVEAEKSPLLTIDRTDMCQTVGRNISRDPNMSRIGGLIFSKDRAMQLQATIESFLLHCKDEDTIDLVVLYKTSNELHGGQYAELKKKFSGINFVEESNFGEQVLSVIEKYDYILFLVDDNIFVKPFSLRDITTALQREKDAVGFSLRLGKNTNYCYPFSSQQALPQFKKVSKGILKYYWPDAEYDFGYPLEVSSSVYRCQDMLQLLNRNEFVNPNTLESLMNQNKNLYNSLPYLLTYEESVTFANPVNIVQNVYENKHGTINNYTSEELAGVFSQGMEVDVEHYIGLTPNAAHQETKLHFKKEGDHVVRISVIVPCYNHAHYLPDAVESIVNQTYKHWECIIVNDGSSDNTAEVAKRLIAEYPDRNIRFIDKPNNTGLADTRNAGIETATSEWILPLDSDDMFERTFMQNAVDIIQQNKRVDIIFTNMQKFGAEHGEWIPSEYSRQKVMFEDTMPYASLYRKELWQKVGGYDKLVGTIRQPEDWNFWISCSKHDPVVRRIAEKLFLYRVDHRSMYHKMIKPNREVSWALLATCHPDLYPPQALVDAWRLIANCPDNIYQEILIAPEKCPEYGLAYFWRALVNRKQGNIDDAMNDCQTAVERAKENDWQGAFVLMRWQKSAGDLGAAAESLNKLLSIRPDFGWARDMLPSSGREDTDSGRRSPAGAQKVLFYFDRIGNLNETSPAGTVIAVLNLAKILQASWPDIEVDITGDLVSHPERYGSFQILPFPSADRRQQFLAEYDIVFFATHIRWFREVPKRPGQIWIIHQHCWDIDDQSRARIEDVDAVICLSEMHRAFLKSRDVSDEKLVIIPNLIDTHVYFPGNVSRNSHSIMFAGGIHPHKGVHLLLDAFQLVRRQIPDVELHLYGDGAMWRGGDDYGNYLKSIKPQGVYFHGYVDNRNMPEIYSKHGTLCLPSVLESFGLVTVEAQACGCIPVVHKVGGVAATLADGRTGLLYEPNTPQKLAETIIKAIGMVEADPSMRQRAIDFARDNFSMANAAKYISRLEDRIAIVRQRRTPRAPGTAGVVEQQLACSRQPGHFQNATDKPLVSVIMPVYNGADYIGRAIESVLAQDYPNFEIVIVDDGSTDNTRQVIQGYHDERIRYFRQENSGVSSARNFGIRNAAGPYIMPLDADDMMAPAFITKHLREFEKHPDADLVYSDVLLIDEGGNPIRVIKEPEYRDRTHLIRDLFRAGHPIVPFRLGIRRSVFDTIGFYDETLLVGEDYDMMRRFVKAGLKARHLGEALHLRRMQPNSLTRNYSAQKAKCHFDVVKRFTDTFTYEELFPDVAWHEIPPDTRQLHAKCLAVVTYLAMGQDFVKSNSPNTYVQMAFKAACSQLSECLRIDPDNWKIRQLLDKCKRGEQKYDEGIQQAVCCTH